MSLGQNNIDIAKLISKLRHSHVVIVDEAHNLIDSILQMHSVSVTLSMLISTRIALLTYIQKFKSRFTGANAAYLKQLAVILKGLCEFATRWGNAALGSAEADAKRASSGVQEEMISVQRLLGEAGGAVDQINLLKLDAYLRSSKIARKVSDSCWCSRSFPLIGPVLC